MSDDEAEVETFLHELRRIIADRMRQQARWHVERGSTADKHRLLEIAAKQEAERLSKIADKHENDGEDFVADLVRAIRDDWLPELVHELSHARL
jgi:hypothetical protein